jgi:hypothetical protein
VDLLGTRTERQAESSGMKADALTPRDLFDSKVQYEIPSFQRPYVWNEEDQWARYGLTLGASHRG